MSQHEKARSARFLNSDLNVLCMDGVWGPCYFLPLLFDHPQKQIQTWSIPPHEQINLISACRHSSLPPNQVLNRSTWAFIVRHHFDSASAQRSRDINKAFAKFIRRKIVFGLQKTLLNQIKPRITGRKQTIERTGKPSGHLQKGNIANHLFDS